MTIVSITLIVVIIVTTNVIINVVALLKTESLLQAELQAAYAALQHAEGRAKHLEGQLESAPLEAAAAANQKV